MRFLPQKNAMNKIKKLTNYFTKGEIILWSLSVFVIVSSFFAFKSESYLTLLASLVGVTSLIFCAKGNPIGQVLMIAFSIIYAVISFGFAYYGEMLTYLGMTLPMAVFSLVSWLKNPFEKDKSEVKVNSLKGKEIAFMFVLSLAVTAAFFFVLEKFNTANIVPSTISVTTSFLAAYLTFRRSAYYALAYGANDIVLIVLWTLASVEDIRYISVVVCFVAFFVNDLYGFISWRKMKKRQTSKKI